MQSHWGIEVPGDSAWGRMTVPYWLEYMETPDAIGETLAFPDLNNAIMTWLGKNCGEVTRKQGAVDIAHMVDVMTRALAPRYRLSNDDDSLGNELGTRLTDFISFTAEPTNVIKMLLRRDKGAPGWEIRAKGRGMTAREHTLCSTHLDTTTYGVWTQIDENVKRHLGMDLTPRAIIDWCEAHRLDDVRRVTARMMIDEVWSDHMPLYTGMDEDNEWLCLNSEVDLFMSHIEIRQAAMSRTELTEEGVVLTGETSSPGLGL